jgi:hypothetical protein
MFERDKEWMSLRDGERGIDRSWLNFAVRTTHPLRCATRLPVAKRSALRRLLSQAMLRTRGTDSEMELNKAERVCDIDWNPMLRWF